MPAETPWRRGIRVRVLAAGVLVAACAIAATAWLAVTSTTGAIQKEQGETAAATALSYRTVVGYAAAHADWAGVGATLAGLRSTTGLDFELTTTATRRLATSGDPARPPGAGKLVAVVDPLAVDAGLLPGAPPDRIDPRATGPFTLPAGERADLRGRADAEAACARAAGFRAEVVTTPSGRAYVDADQEARRRCDRLGVEVTGRPSGDEVALQLTATETAALGDLNVRMATCLDGLGPADRGSGSKARLTASGAFVPAASVGSPGFTTCLAQSRHSQLTPYVAPAALLFVADPAAAATPPVGLPAAGAIRIVVAASAVLVLTIVVGLVLAGRVLRPLRVLTEAANRMRRGDHSARADVAARWEIADVARAFNAMADQVERTEKQRIELVSDVSHELRTPVGTLRGWLIATQDGLADLDPELVESLLEETDVLRHLVDDLQDLAAADAGELRISFDTVDVGEVLAQIAATRPDTVVAEVPGPLWVRGDRVRLRQLFGNLVANALRYSPPGDRVVLRGTRRGDFAELTVTDHGPGIAAEDLPHVFDRFWRADKSRSRATGGSGLGLAIVKHLAEAHGGTVGVHSEPGVATTFRVSLRFEPSERGEDLGQPVVQHRRGDLAGDGEELGR
ncbi:ATP-binding protein [Amycolatopsis rhabdoformis]|uniref:histidine kinase n=1 Tax=Amycolatopsis rhabdoformis TaxID=1448059 RepID=A0ABZ1IDM0_9PSEU|nr:ATP-binding protein [Amycolatopsis rhabdoformis]WSE32517.1 ATP-binding protein [Amycolatopsis rhabdoformis]